VKRPFAVSSLFRYLGNWGFMMSITIMGGAQPEKGGYAKMSRAFFYIFGSEGNTEEGKIAWVPADCGGTIFMGFCMPTIRSKAKKWDWIIGISNSRVSPRKILSIIEVNAKPKLWKAIKKYPQAMWGEGNPEGQICVEATRNDAEWEYRYIPGAPHSESNRYNDLEKYPDTDTLLVGTSNSIVLGRDGYLVDERILATLKKDERLKNEEIDVNAPLGRMFNTRTGRWVPLSYPPPAIVDLDKKEIHYLKKIVDIAKSNRKTSASVSFDQRGKCALMREDRSYFQKGCQKSGNSKMHRGGRCSRR